jgi:hypothetical protein
MPTRYGGLMLVLDEVDVVVEELGGALEVVVWTTVELEDTVVVEVDCVVRTDELVDVEVTLDVVFEATEDELDTVEFEVMLVVEDEPLDVWDELLLVVVDEDVALLVDDVMTPVEMPRRSSTVLSE